MKRPRRLGAAALALGLLAPSSRAESPPQFLLAWEGATGGIAVDGLGRVWLAGPGLTVHDPDGVAVGSVELSGLLGSPFAPVGIALWGDPADPPTTLVVGEVGDFGYDHVVSWARADGSRRRVRDFSLGGDQWDLKVDADGVVWVLDSSEISRYDRNGTRLGAWATRDGVPARGIAPDGRGHVYVTTIGAVQKYDTDGTFILEWTRSGHGAMGPAGIVADPEGSVFVVDELYHRVHKFSPDGELIYRFGYQGSEEGFFESPTRIAIGPDGSVYVVDRGNGRVQKFGRPVPVETESFGSVKARWR